MEAKATNKVIVIDIVIAIVFMKSKKIFIKYKGKKYVLEKGKGKVQETPGENDFFTPYKKGFP